MSSKTGTPSTISDKMKSKKKKSPSNTTTTTTTTTTTDNKSVVEKKTNKKDLKRKLNLDDMNEGNTKTTKTSSPNKKAKTQATLSPNSPLLSSKGKNKNSSALLSSSKQNKNGGDLEVANSSSSGSESGSSPLLEYILMFLDMQAYAKSELDFASLLPEEYEILNFHRTEKTPVACLSLLDTMSVSMNEKDAMFYLKSILLGTKEKKEKKKDSNNDSGDVNHQTFFQNDDKQHDVKLEKTVLAGIILYHRILQKLGYIKNKNPKDFDPQQLKKVLESVYNEYKTKNLSEFTSNVETTTKGNKTSDNKDDDPKQRRNNAKKKTDKSTTTTTTTTTTNNKRKKGEDKDASAADGTKSNNNNNNNNRVSHKKLVLVKPKDVAPLECTPRETPGVINKNFTTDNLAFAYLLENLPLNQDGGLVEVARWFLVGLTKKVSEKNGRVTHGFQVLPLQTIRELYPEEKKKKPNFWEKLEYETRTVKVYKDGNEENQTKKNLVDITIPRYCENQLPKTLKNTHHSCSFAKELFQVLPMSQPKDQQSQPKSPKKASTTTKDEKEKSSMGLGESKKKATPEEEEEEERSSTTVTKKTKPSFSTGAQTAAKANKTADELLQASVPIKQFKNDNRQGKKDKAEGRMEVEEEEIESEEDSESGSKQENVEEVEEKEEEEEEEDISVDSVDDDNVSSDDSSEVISDEEEEEGEEEEEEEDGGEDEE